jgi:hypothetical protein
MEGLRLSKVAGLTPCREFRETKIETGKTKTDGVWSPQRNGTALVGCVRLVLLRALEIPLFLEELLFPTSLDG